MTLTAQQKAFSKDFMKLLKFADDNGYEFQIKEVQRTKETQELYIKKGVSKTMNSRHLDCLAGDVYFSKDDVSISTYLNCNTDVEKEALKSFLKPLTDYWESLSEYNSAGATWNFFDAPHFERKKI